MKKLARLIGISAALAFMVCAGRALAETLDIWVNPTTWAFDHVNCPVQGDCHDDPEDGAWTNVVSYAVTGYDPQGEPETRYYFAGGWTAVNIWNAGNPSQLLQTLSCNNIFYIKGTQAYALTVNENGGLDGVSGEVTDLKSLSNGDLVIVGRFTWAGGNDHAYHFTCFEFNDGRLHAQGRNEDINAPLDTTTRGTSTVVWDGYRLKIIEPSMTTVNGPTYSGGPTVAVSVSNGTVWWNGSTSSFADGYWQTQ